MRVPQITIDMMVAVIALAHERTFEKAAEEIGMITASAVHKRVQAASKLFGAPLFINSADGMTITAAGEAFYTDAVRAVEQTLLAEERVAARLNLEAQHLRIGHSTYLPPRSLGAVLKLKLEGKPPIQIEHISGLTHDLARRVEEGERHAGFGYLPLNGANPISPGNIDHKVETPFNLFDDRCQVQAAARPHRESSKSMNGLLGPARVNRGQCSSVPRVHGVEQCPRLRTANFSDQDAVGTMALTSKSGAQN